MNCVKKNLLGVLISPLDYATACSQILEAARNQTNLGVSALAVHGIMLSVRNKAFRYRLNQLNLVVPDGQPVRWAINHLYRLKLSDRVYGPTLMLKLCQQAADQHLPIYLYGSHPSTLTALQHNLQAQFPALKITGTHPSAFRTLSTSEQESIAQKIRDSGAKMVFVGLGCPRQEIWVYEHRELLPMPLIAVGAAFDFHSGTLPQAPAWMQRNGLEWLFRLRQEPRRLWQRYLLLNPLYLLLWFLQATHLKTLNPTPLTTPPEPIRYG